MALSPEMQALLKNAKNKYTSGGNNKIVTLKEGKTKVRILPWQNPNAPTGQFWQDAGVHWIKADPAGKPIAVVGCHQHVYDKPCPICQSIDKSLAATRNDDQVKLIKDWKAKKQVLVNALIRSGDNKSDVPVVLGLTPTTFANFLSMMEEYADSGISVVDLNEGLDLIIERRGKGLDTEYAVMASPKSEVVPRGVADKYIDLAAFVEKEHFGNDAKGLNAIASVTGITAGALTSPSGRTAGALTGPKTGGKVIDVEVDERDVRTSTVRHTETVIDAEVDDLDSILDDLA